MNLSVDGKALERWTGQKLHSTVRGLTLQVIYVTTVNLPKLNAANDGHTRMCKLIKDLS